MILKMLMILKYFIMFFCFGVDYIYWLFFPVYFWAETSAVDQWKEVWMRSSPFAEWMMIKRFNAFIANDCAVGNLL